MASIVAGTVQVVISTPKEAVRKARPTMAGLNTLAPSPPKAILATPTAITEPMAAAQKGNAGGSDNARITPVTTALRSQREPGFLRMRLQTHSVAIHQTTQTPIRIRPRARK